jgi:hypothetical protein
MGKSLHILQHYYNSFKAFFTTRYDLKEYMLHIGISLVIGVAAGLGSMVFHTLIEWMRFAINPGTELEFVIMVIAVSCVKLLSAHNSTQHTSRKHKV